MSKSASGSKANISPQLKIAWKLYESGDVVAARREALKVIQAPASPADAAQAADLVDRTKVPTSALVLALVAAVLIALMILLAVARS